MAVYGPDAGGRDDYGGGVKWLACDGRGQLWVESGHRAGGSAPAHNTRISRFASALDRLDRYHTARRSLDVVCARKPPNTARDPAIEIQARVVLCRGKLRRLSSVCVRPVGVVGQRDHTTGHRILRRYRRGRSCSSQTDLSRRVEGDTSPVVVFWRWASLYFAMRRKRFAALAKGHNRGAKAIWKLLSTVGDESSLRASRTWFSCWSLGLGAPRCPQRVGCGRCSAASHRRR